MNAEQLKNLSPLIDRYPIKREFLLKMLDVIDAAEEIDKIAASYDYLIGHIPKYDLHKLKEALQNLKEKNET